jgi:hypothetical protein
MNEKTVRKMMRRKKRVGGVFKYSNTLVELVLRGPEGLVIR